MIRTIFFAIALLSLGSWIGLNAQAQDDVLLSIENEPVKASEFVWILNKNKAALGTDKTSLRESLDLFINLKLKVREAKALGLDTTIQFKKELQGHRKQLAKPYLMDQQITDELVREAYERSKWEVRTSHLVIACKPDASAADTLLAYRRVMGIRDRLLNGEEFAAVAKEVSDDPSAATNGGDIGYWTVFGVVYPFETAMYSLKVGEISMPVRTTFGYHLIQVTDKQPAKGKIKVATIWKAVDMTTTDEEKARIREEMNNIYIQLRSGADFEELGRKYSDDRSMPNAGFGGFWMGPREKEPVFDQAAYALKNPGDITEPLETSLGWFIIRLLDRKPFETFEESKATISNLIKRNPERAVKSEQAVVEKLKQEYHFTVNQANLEEFYRLVDPSIFESRWDANPALQRNGTLFTIADVVVPQSSFAKFLSFNMKESSVRTIAEYVDDKFDQFVRKSILEYEEANLDKKYPEFKNLYQEFYDGNLLFEISEKLIWNQAVRDTAGLKEFFNAHQDNYQWPERLDAVVIYCKGFNQLQDMVEDFGKTLKKKCNKGCSGVDIENILGKEMANYPGNSFEIEDKLYTKGSNWIIDQVKWKPGASAIIDEQDTKIFVWINKVLPVSPRKLDEMKGQVTADYQDYLEKELIKSLREKYPVKVNQDVLSKIKI